MDQLTGHGIRATIAPYDASTRGFAGWIVKVGLRVGHARHTLDVLLQKLEHRHLAPELNQGLVMYLRDRQLAGRLLAQESLPGL